MKEMCLQLSLHILAISYFLGHDWSNRISIFKQKILLISEKLYFQNEINQLSLWDDNKIYAWFLLGRVELLKNIVELFMILASFSNSYFSYLWICICYIWKS